MKRSEIINQLLNEGFTANTLMNFSDKQLLSLSSRINESLTVSQKTLDTDPNIKTKVSNMAKSTDVKIVPEEGMEEGAMPGLKNRKEVKEAGVPGLTAKKSSGELKNGTAEKEMKESGVPGLTAKKSSGELKNGTAEKEMKESGVPGLTAKKSSGELKNGTAEKEMKESGVPGLKAKVVKETGVPGLTAKKSSGELKNGTSEKEMKEGAMPGLTVGGKSNVSKSSNPIKKESEEIDETHEGDEKEENDEKGGKKDKHEAFIEMLKKKKENKSINEWVENVAQKHYHPFTTKNDIMEMIMTKLEETEVETNEEVTEKLPKFLKYQAIKGSGAAPAPAEPKTKPGTKTPPKQNPNERPKTPYRPGPGINPAPKAGVRSNRLTETNNVPVTKPGNEIKKLNNPPKK